MAEVSVVLFSIVVVAALATVLPHHYQAKELLQQQ